ncbi:MAG: hypothetical protein GEU98_16070 [Pseudonocardiaceae bacterium]|nr:hypothetical protein [Pseudonocardiaceae bacterium]
MTVRSARVAARTTLNMPLIRERVAALGLVDGQVATAIGVSLYELGRDPDSRAVSLTILVRLSRLLELPLDELVVTDDPHVHSPDQPESAHLDAREVGDDYLLMGLVATYNGLGIVRILNLLGWTRPRLDAALTVIGEHLAHTALRVVATDERLTLMLRPDVIPAVVRAQFEHEYRLDYPLDPNTAVAVLELVREKILEPFPEHDDQRPYARPQSFDAAYLVGARLAVPVAPSADGTNTTEIEIHPDVLFALGLVDAPAENIV